MPIHKKSRFKQALNLDIAPNGGRLIHINKQGQAKLRAARAFGFGALPEWLRRSIKSDEHAAEKSHRKKLHRSR